LDNLDVIVTVGGWVGFVRKLRAWVMPAVHMTMIVMCLYSSYMVVILPRSQTSHGTRMNLGLFVPYQKTT